MMRYLAGRVLVAGLAVASACAAPPEEYRAAAADPELLHGAVAQVTDAMMASITSPPVASRNYAYASIAAYEALQHAYPQYRSLAGQVNGLASVPEPEPEAEYLPGLAGVTAFLAVAEKLVFDPSQVVEYRDSVMREMRRRGVPRKVLSGSQAYGEAVAKHVLAWAETDGIKAARAAPRLEVRPEPGLWVPTPPVYLDAVEGNWGTLRPFVLTSGDQFETPPHTPYDLREGSAFRQQVEEVYRVGQNLTPEQAHIASFWDCNPFAVMAQGHMVTAEKKISPGGHWLSVTRIALGKSNADLGRAAEAYAKVSMALADGFISAWHEKYRTVRVRPVTIIHQALDGRWHPLLQTPPFPEYPSGHSVISAAAAEVLTELFGDGFAYTDSTNVRFGIPARSFTSFKQAAQEAAISRLYGGIHYRDGIDGGLVVGRAVGEEVASRIRTRPPALAGDPQPRS